MSREADVAEWAVDEMAYVKSESRVNPSGSSAGIPCQLRFVEETSQDTERFHASLSENGFSALDSNPDRRRSGEGPYYDGELCSTEHYNRVRIAVIRGDIVRIFPKEAFVPTVEEMTRIIRSIEDGFGAELQHYPLR